jgi:hypothetical protein
MDTDWGQDDGPATLVILIDFFIRVIRAIRG